MQCMHSKAVLTKRINANGTPQVHGQLVATNRWVHGLQCQMFLAESMYNSQDRFVLEGQHGKAYLG